MKDGSAKCVIVSTAERNAALPEAASAGDLGLAEKATALWRGLIGPPGLPADRVAVLREAFAQAVRSDTFQAFIQKRGELGIGGPGAPSTNQLFDGGDAVELPTKFVRTFLGGQVVRHVTAGAGGYGDPFARDPGLVLADVRNGKVTPGAAEKAYGVRVDGPPWRIDEAATARLRLDRSRSGGTAETAETAETSEPA